MGAILTLTLPFFAVIGLGFFAGRIGMIPLTSVPHINVFVFNFAMPALIVGALSKQPISVLLDGRFLLAWTAAGLFVFVVGAFGARFAGMKGLSGAAICGQAAAVGNVGFLALPLVIVAFGAAHAGLAAAALIIDLVILVPLSIALLEVAKGRTDLRRAGARTFGNIVFNPFLISIAVGVALSAWGFALPVPVQRFVDFLAAAAAPTALFALGLTLAGRHVRGDLAGIALMSALKLCVHPLSAFAALTAIGLHADKVAIGTVIAAMPVAGNVFVIAQQYGIGRQRSSAAILITTAIAVVSVAVAISWAKGIVS